MDELAPTGSTTGYYRLVCAFPENPDGHFRFVTTTDGGRALMVMNARTGVCERMIKGLEFPVESLCAIPGRRDGRVLVVGGLVDGTLKVWDMSSGACERTIALSDLPEDEDILDMCAIPENRDGHSRVVVVFSDGTLNVIDVSSGVCERTLTSPKPVGCLCAIPANRDGHCRVVTGSCDKTLDVWNVDLGVLEHTLTGHTGPIRGVCAIPANRDGQCRVVSASMDRTLRVWVIADEIGSSACERILTGHTDWVQCVCVIPSNPNGPPPYAASGSADGTLRVWNLNSGEGCLMPMGTVRAIMNVCSASAKVVSNTVDGRLHLWTVVLPGSD